jgi:hypothetical protein
LVVTPTVPGILTAFPPRAVVPGGDEGLPITEGVVGILAAEGAKTAGGHVTA